MAQRTIVQLTDDLDGRAIPDGKGETIRFSLDQTDYEIDLNDKNSQALRDAIGKYVAAARRVSGSSSSGGGRGAGARRAGGRSGASPVRDYDPKAVRAWAEAQGIEVSQRGRVSADLVAKFQAADA